MRRIVTYERVSYEDQRERSTIKTQRDELAAEINREPDVNPGTRYIDDGVSGKIPMALQPAGKRLLADAARGLFDEVWVWKIDRLGRDYVDPLVVWRDLELLGIKLRSVTEGISDPCMYHIHVAMAAQERRNFMARSPAEMNEAAREGRYCGGIVPLGYVVEGRKQHARLTPSELLIWGDWTESKLIRQIYRWLSIEGWPCPRIADHLNTLGVPTVYTKDDRMVKRGQRKDRTQGLWRAARIRNLLNNPVYKGKLQYVRVSPKPESSEIIAARISKLVSKEVWQAAQETLSGNRIMPKNTKRNYLLKSVIRCGGCGRYYTGSWGRRFVWYRCNGQLTDRGPKAGRCSTKALKGTNIDQPAWEEIERFLWDPGEILEELSRDKEMEAGAAIAEAERVTLEAALSNLDLRRKNTIDLKVRRRISDGELDEHLVQIPAEQEGVEARLQGLQATLVEPEGHLGPDPLEQLRRKLDKGMDDIRRQAIVKLLVKRITVYTEVVPGGKKLKVLIQYRFHAVVNDFTGTGSSLQPLVRGIIRLRIRNVIGEYRSDVSEAFLRTGLSRVGRGCTI